MRFFVPFAQSREAAELLWTATRSRLLDLGLPTTGRRIHALSIRPDVKRRVEVGLEMPEDPGPVMMIFEAVGIDLFFVCTPSRGVLAGRPFPIRLDDEGEVIDFDEEAGGRG
ncbi:MAG: hypothetical protein JOZ90_14600 [Alphaproteobacteria bacterium]|nr:hypothetical protein [Alphaproteobacteria bacterium]MBV9372172.1 hypothetical protein [Alphaproteobacteria bacterium]MBV9902303.1 hypothetical protein [Alphaproteobacteria bacterium]